MAREPKLKVFRMPVGFHDAYVAAPSQKAAIEAWGSDKDVFARGQAELVTDPELTKEPLAHPGKVVKRLRGTAAEQIAALGKEEAPAPQRRGKAKQEQVRKQTAKGRPKPAPKPRPRPSRAKLDEAEAALQAVEARHEEERAELAEREAALKRERAAVEAKQTKERGRIEARREKAQAAYDEAMGRWRKQTIVGV